MMDVLFSFDTEDYHRPQSNDALLALARSHTRHQAPACFGIVGEKARFLRDNGRRDVIEALKDHEIAYHSDHHFTLPDHRYAHPYLPGYLDRVSWDEGLTRLLAEESRGVHDVVETFAVRPVTWLRNYGDYTPHYVYAMSRLGLGVYAYGPSFRGSGRSPQDKPWRPIWYANMLSVGGPRMTYEDHLHDTSSFPQKLAAYKETLLTHLEQGTPRLNVVTHPTQFCSREWPMQKCFDGDWPPRAGWADRVSPCYERSRQEALLETADAFIGFVARLPDVRIRTFSDLWEEYGGSPQWIPRASIKTLARKVLQNGLRWQHVGCDTFSPAELFGLFAQCLAAPDRTHYFMRHPLGPVEEPFNMPAGLRVRRDVFGKACRNVEDGLRDHDRVPAAVHTEQGRIGPASFLAAMADGLVAPAGARYVDVPPLDNRPLPLLPDDYDLLAAGRPACMIQDRSFMGPNLRRFAAWQYWTVKPARPE